MTADPGAALQSSWEDGVVFMRVNSPCAHQLRPPLGCIPAFGLPQSCRTLTPRFGRGDEGSPALPRHEPTCRREEEPFGPRHSWTRASSAEDGELVSKYDDLEVLEFVRPTAQERELRNTPKHRTTERGKHEASNVAGDGRHSTLQRVPESLTIVSNYAIVERSGLGRLIAQDGVSAVRCPA